MAALLLLLILAAACHAQFVPAPVDFYATTYNSSGLTHWQPCLLSQTSETTLTLARVLAQCGGTRLLLGCADGSGATAPAAATNASLATGGGSYTNSLPPGNTIGVTRNASVWHVGAGAPPALCSETAGDALCFAMSGDAFAAGAYCGAALGFVVSPTVYRVFYTNPCEGHAVNATCASPLGACAIAPACNVNGTCAAASPAPADTACVDAYTCDTLTGNLTVTYLVDGAACVYGNNSCVAGAVCAANHSCVPSVLAPCSPPNACYVNGTCNIATQACEYAAAPVDTVCSVATPCHGTGVCLANQTCAEAATPAPALTCYTPTTCADIGGWAYVPAVAGTNCTSANKCLSATTCDGAGACNGTAAVCPVLACRGPPTCTPTTGLCAATADAPGTPCDDGDPCTQGTTCSVVASCGGGAPAITCPGTAPACQQYVRAAINSTTCVCVLVDITNGTACDDGDACTDDDKCFVGTCAGTPVTCPGDDCNNPLGVCSPATRCWNPKNGTALACNTDCRIGGLCVNGTCGGGSLNVTNPNCVPGAAQRNADPWLAALLDGPAPDYALARAGSGYMRSVYEHVKTRADPGYVRSVYERVVARALDVLSAVAIGDGEGPDRHGRVRAA